MNRADLEELICDRMVELIDQAAWHQQHGNELERDLCRAEARELKDAASDNNYEFFFMMYHRYMSESFGVEFEQDHGDEELMFGGV